MPSDLRCFLPEGCQARAPKYFGVKQDEPGDFLPSTGLEQLKLKQKVPRLTSRRVLFVFCVEWTQRRERRHMGLRLSFPSPLWMCHPKGHAVPGPTGDGAARMGSCSC